MASAKQKAVGRRNLKKSRKKLKPSANKFMRKKGKTKGKAIATNVRKRTATVVEKQKGPKGGGTRYRFPIPDVTHARNALARLPQAKGLSADEKKKIVRTACKVLAGGDSKKLQDCLSRHNLA